MYNPMLDTFITVADCGSFTKAAAQLYISPTAVMKQMNALEQHLQLQLIERTPAGVHLTPAGNVIYRDAKFLMDYSKKSIAAANAAAHTYDTTFCVGTSLLNPAKDHNGYQNRNDPFTFCIPTYICHKKRCKRHEYPYPHIRPWQET